MYSDGTAPGNDAATSTSPAARPAHRSTVLVAEPLGRSSDVGSYTLQSGAIGNGVFAEPRHQEHHRDGGLQLDRSTTFTNDIDAFNNGFIVLTVLNPDLGDR